MKIWGKPYFVTYDRILSHYGLPTELKYLSVVESDLIGKAVSVCGAVGPWQLMPELAIDFGLKITSRVMSGLTLRKVPTLLQKCSSTYLASLMIGR